MAGANGSQHTCLGTAGQSPSRVARTFVCTFLLSFRVGVTEYVQAVGRGKW